MKKVKKMSLKGVHDLNDLLARDSNKQLLDAFIEEKLATCKCMIITWENDEGNVETMGNIETRMKTMGMLAMASYLVPITDGFGEDEEIEEGDEAE